MELGQWSSHWPRHHSNEGPVSCKHRVKPDTWRWHECVQYCLRRNDMWNDVCVAMSGSLVALDLTWGMTAGPVWRVFSLHSSSAPAPASASGCHVQSDTSCAAAEAAAEATSARSTCGAISGHASRVTCHVSRYSRACLGKNRSDGLRRRNPHVSLSAFLHFV